MTGTNIYALFIARAVRFMRCLFLIDYTLTRGAQQGSLLATNLAGRNNHRCPEEGKRKETRPSRVLGSPSDQMTWPGEMLEPMTGIDAAPPPVALKERRPLMAPKEKFSTETQVQQLKQEGFSQEQIDRLLALRALSTQGGSHEEDPQRKRQEFIRWLYLQGRLQS